MRAKKSNPTPWLMGLGLLAFLLTFGVIFALNRSNAPAPAPKAPVVVKQYPSPPTIKLPSKKTKPITPKFKNEYVPPVIKTEEPFNNKFEKPPSETEPNFEPKPKPKEEPPGPAAEPEPAKREPIPEGEPLQSARRWIREKYRAQLLQTKTPAEKQAALEVLIEAAGDPEQIPAQRYVLLQRASELAIELIDLPTLTLLNRELATRFEADYYKLQGEALIEAERKATSPEQGRDLYTAAGELLDEACKLRRYDAAVEAAEVAGRSARRAGDPEAQRSAEEYQKELKAKLAAQQAGTEPGPLEKLPAGVEVARPKLKVDGLINYWKFDETSGNEALCSISNQRSPFRGNPQWVTGRVGGGVELKSGTYVEVVDGPKFDQHDAYTMAAWVSTSHTEPMAVIARTDDGNSYQGFDLSLIDLIPYTVLAHKHPSSSLVVAGTEAFSANQWHHIAATHDGSGKATGMKIYLDGVLQTPKVLTDTLNDSTLTDAPLHIGQRKSSLSYVGLLDEVRIYDRALTANEISALVKEAGKMP